MDLENLVNRVLSGEATREEQDRLNIWKRRRPENREEFESLRLLWEYARRPEVPKKSDPGFYAGLNRIKARIRQLIRRDH